MDWLRYDVRLALRDYIKRPGLALVMIGTLAIGMGVNAVAFGAFDVAMLRRRESVEKDDDVVIGDAFAAACRWRELLWTSYDGKWLYGTLR